MTRDGTRFWTNVYHVNALTLSAAASFANTVIAPMHQSQLYEDFSVVKTLVDHLADDTFVSTPLALPGLSEAVDFLPLFNTVKVNIAVDGFGRNDFKFIRGWLSEASIENGQINPSSIAVYQGLFDELISDGTAAGVDLVDSQGNLWLTAAVQQAVQMRQLHRRRARVVTP